MIRKNKLKKLERRRERGTANSISRHPAFGRMPSTRGLMTLSYTVSFQPLENPPPEQQLMNVFDDDRIEELFYLVHDDPAMAVEQLRVEREKHPGIPTLAQWLSTALYATGQQGQADQVVEENFRCHPNYLFARLNYYKMLVGRGEIDAVEKLLDGKVDLKLMYPERDVFHVTEVKAFVAFMIHFLIRKGQADRAEHYMEILEAVAPDAPGIDEYRQLLDTALLLHSVREMRKKALIARAVRI